MTKRRASREDMTARVRSPWLRLVGSLRMAVLLLIAIASVLVWGTIYEAQFGTAAVQRVVYRSWWFEALLGFLAVNLAAAAVQRYPWKRQHAPFLLAHLGIISILVGGIIGGRFGVEGQLIIPEGQAERVLQLPNDVLAVYQPNPGETAVLPTDFAARAWVHEPHAQFRIPHAGHDIQLVVDRYYPDAVTDERITDDADAENPAIELRLQDGEQADDVWLLSRDPERAGFGWADAHVLFLEPSSTAQWAQLLGLPGPDLPARGQLELKLPELGVTRVIPVPEHVGQPLAIDGTPYTITFKEYFTDLAMIDHGIVNRSDELNNPAVSFTLSGREGTESYLAFALYPDFELMHNRERAIHAHIRYTHRARASLPPNTIALLRHPSGALSCVVTGAGDETHLAACEIGGRYTHPWLGYGFELVHVYPRARVTTEFRNRSREVKAEALHVVAHQGQAVADGWVGMHGQLELPLEGEKPITVEYRPDQRELPYTIKLLDFRKTDYPGTQMAASFESDLELTDTARGIVLMRTISMNHPLKYRGYTFFQSSYVPGNPETTILSVRNDPGTPLVYAGFLIVIAGVVSLFVLRAKATSRKGVAR